MIVKVVHDGLPTLRAGAVKDINREAVISKRLPRFGLIWASVADEIREGCAARMARAARVATMDILRGGHQRRPS